MTKRFLSGSAQTEVPVNPVCPNDRSLKSEPAELYPLTVLVSQPRPRVLFGPCFVVNNLTVSGFRKRFPPYLPPFISICMKTERSDAVENKPACPDTPPKAKAFSSCT